MYTEGSLSDVVFARVCEFASGSVRLGGVVDC